MAAALAASDAGASVTLVEERLALGGQIYKQASPELEARHAPREDARHRRGRAMIATVLNSPVEVLTDAVVWSIRGTQAFVCRHDREVWCVDAGAIVIAAGAYDRPVPFPGWTLPGVMTAGGAQSLVKTSGVAPGRRILMAGSGPLSLAFAAELRSRGANVVMLAEAAPRPAARSLFRLLRAAPGNLANLTDGARYLAYLRARRVPIRWSTMICRAEGQSRVERAVVTRVDNEWRPIPGSEEGLEVDTICLGYGLLPSNELARLCGCDHEYDEARGGFVPRRDEWMRSSVPGVLVAGDCAGIGGADAAIDEGRLAGLAAAVEIGRLDAGKAAVIAARARRRLGRRQRLAAALRHMYRIGGGIYDLADNGTVICRCEEVTLADIRAAFGAAPADVQGVKEWTRAGMGLCQGRMCGRQVAAEVAKIHGLPLGSVVPYSVRPPVKPVPVAAVAAEMPERQRPIVELES